MTRLNFCHRLPESARLDLPGFSAEPRPYSTSVEIHAKHSTLPAAVAALLPADPNRCLDNDGWRALWLRPNGWLLVNPHPTAALHPSMISEAAAGRLRSVDVSHARTAIALSGGAMRAVLSKGTPFDLRTTRFRIGHCAQTCCAGFSMLLDHQENLIMVHVESPLAVAFWTWLKKASSTLY